MTPNEFRVAGHSLIDWIADYWTTIGDRPVQSMVQPGEIRAMLPDSAPEQGESFDVILGDLDRVVMPGITHWQHPGWFAYFPANASLPSVLGELAAAALGQQGMLWSTSPACTEIEAHVLDWLVDLCGVPQPWKNAVGPGGGVLQSSASDGAHTALVVARERAISRGATTDQLTAYVSEQAHSSLEKGTRVAGYRHIRLVPADAGFALEPAALEKLVAADRAAGLHPAFVCSTVGTTGTTAVDPVRATGEIARTNAMWHHVDAAYAGSAMICPEFRHHQDGLELVDSYTFNPHKWLLTNFDCSVFWVADRSELIRTLSILPPYLRNQASDSGQVIDYRDWHVPLGRRFRALKLWWVLRSYGADALRTRIREHVRLAQELEIRVRDHPRLELIAPTTFALVSFRHVGGDEATDALADRLNDSGEVYITASTVAGRRFVRVSIGATTTEAQHVERLWELIAAATT